MSPDHRIIKLFLLIDHQGLNSVAAFPNSFMNDDKKDNDEVNQTSDNQSNDKLYII